MLKLQIGAGLDGPSNWLNLDASPVLRLQRLPLVGGLLRRVVPPEFSPNIRYGNVTRTLPLADGEAGIVYTSHMLEHLSLTDFDLALLEIRRVLAPGGLFRSVMPDLEFETRNYLASNAPDRASDFMRATLLGVETRPRGLMPVLRGWLGNSMHLWLWDFVSVSEHLARAGFVDIRRAHYGDSGEPAFLEVENAERWQDCLGFECRKPA